MRSGALLSTRQSNICNNCLNILIQYDTKVLYGFTYSIHQTMLTFVSFSLLLILSHSFCSFLSGPIQPACFPKNPALSHTTIYGPRKVSEKTNERVPRKLTDRCKDRQTEGRKDISYFIRAFRKHLEVLKLNVNVKFI